MPATQPITIGLDMGTGGARAIAMTLDGRLVATGRAHLPDAARHTDGPIVEQDPHAWSTAAIAALSQLAAALPAGAEPVALAVDATSGTVLLVDHDHRPLTPGIMYNDLRAAAPATSDLIKAPTPNCTARAAAAVGPALARYGVAIAPAFALPKILYLLETQPALVQRVARIVHETDWLVALLTGARDVTDASTALKTGVDLGALTWPPALTTELGLNPDWLPRVVLPGTRIATLSPTASSQTGLPTTLVVYAGCTDGTAGALASGAAHPGDLNVTLGTTLVFKAVAQTPLADPAGAIYNHRHPAGGFLPGAASSTGGEWIDKYLPTQDLQDIGRRAADRIPTRHSAYPLVRQGERFPFACPAATGFGLDLIPDPVEQFAAGMEGVAFLERLGIARFEQLGLPIGPTVFATGGAAAGETWLQIRAAVNRRTYAVPDQPECAVGAAVLAAAGHLGDYAAAAARLVRITRRVEPDTALAAAYDERYAAFCATLNERGYL
jgi:sugar (pentulose or hexulose) kinase